MSVFEYDKALVEHFRKIFTSGKIFISEIDNIYDTTAFQNNDRIKLPLINLRRTGWKILDRGTNVSLHTGLTVKAVEKELVTRVQNIPIGINYNIDVITRTRKENDFIMRELIFYFKLHPTLVVDVNYNGIIFRHNFNIMFEDEIEDNSEISEHKNTGEVFRQTIGIYTDDAYLWKLNKAKPATIDPEDILIEIKES